MAIGSDAARRGVRRGLIAAAAVLAVPLWVLGMAGAAAGASCASGAASFSVTGGEQCYTVPVGYTFVRVDAVGALGEAAQGVSGGFGAVTGGVLPVSPGETLYVEVGGPGASSGGGFNGGGNGGGGGASDVRTCPRAPLSCTGGGSSLGSRLLVAGGGGAAGGTGHFGDLAMCSGKPGGAGGSAGSAPQAGETSPGFIALGGAGGAPGGSTGGLGGAGSQAFEQGASGGSGALGVGGDGGDGDGGGQGGGGGGGYFGGGGGGGGGTSGHNGLWCYGGGGGGGAGSSFITSSALDPSVTTTRGTPFVSVTPAIGLLFKTNRATVVSGKTRIRLACSNDVSGTCRGWLSLTAPVRVRHRGAIGYQRVTVARARYSLANGRNKLVTVQLFAFVPRLLASTPNHRLSVRASATLGRGSTLSAPIKLTE